MKINLDKDLIKEILIQETFYNRVPEFYYLKEAGYKIVQEMSREGGCTACAERNLIEPTVMSFISHTVNLLLECGRDSLIKFKDYVKDLLDIKEDFEISVLYKDTPESETTEILI
jgi:hypothetical protein